MKIDARGRTGFDPTVNMMPLIDSIAALAQQWGASDIFFAEGQPPRLKVNRVFHEREGEVVTTEDMKVFARACGCDPETLKDVDTTWIAPCHVRFRVNVHRRGGVLGAVLRQIRLQVPTMEELGLPASVLSSWLNYRAGLILITGPTGCGKSTTVASCLDWLSASRAGHIITIEDPIEYQFTDRLGFFTQREIGADTPSYSSGLFHASRQAPDTIFLGEICDAESALTCLNAAETGHLVISTLHSPNVAETLERLCGLIPATEREMFLAQFAGQTIGILSQRLVVDTQCSKVVPILEHLEIHGAVREWIREKDTGAITDHMRRPDVPGNRSFLSSICDAYHAGNISYDTALANTTNAVEFNRALRGVS